MASKPTRIHASPEDHGRTYQQGSGSQYNIERGFFLDPDRAVSWFNDVDFWPTIREIDPLEAGVHRSSVLHGSAVTPYISRDVDQEIRQRLSAMQSRGGLVLIAGDSTAGKTRAAYEAALAILPGYKMFMPHDADTLRAGIPALLTTEMKCILWLDDFDRFVPAGILTASLIGHLSRRGVVTIATIRSERYRRLLDLESEAPEGHDESGSTTSHHAFTNFAEPVVIHRRWSEAEKGRAALESDSRVQDALAHGDAFGLAEFIAAGPSLHKHLLLATETSGSARGAALVMSAIDLTRAGLGGVMTQELLVRTHPTYLSDGHPLVSLEPVDQAFRWATARRFGVTSFLMRGSQDGRFHVFDYLVDTREKEDSPIPPETWTAATEFAGDDQEIQLRVALAAAVHDQSDLALTILHTLADDGFLAASRPLGRLLLRLGDVDQAAQVFEAAFEAGDSEAAVQLGLSFERAGESDTAIAWFRRAASEQNQHGMAHLGMALHGKGKVSEAEKYLREAADNDEAAWGLGQLLSESGRLEEAGEMLNQRAIEGSTSAVLAWGSLLADAGLEERAEHAWEEALKGGVEEAAFNLGALAAKQERYQEAERWYAIAAARGVPESRARLGGVLAQLGKTKKAERELQRAISEEGDSAAMGNLATVLINRGDYRGAAHWARQAVGMGEIRANAVLGDALEELGDLPLAVGAWREGASSGEPFCQYRLGKWHKSLGELEDAERHLRAAADSEIAEAACQLATLLEESERHEESVERLKQAATLGHGHANCVLGTIALDEGDFDGAERAWSMAFAQGHTDAAGRLSRILMAQPGRRKEAADWLRRARGVNDNAGKRKAKRRTNKSRRK